MEAKSQLFLKYFTLFMNLLNDCGEAGGAVLAGSTIFATWFLNTISRIKIKNFSFRVVLQILNGLYNNDNRVEWKSVTEMKN
jgi:hypothetical protein